MAAATVTKTTYGFKVTGGTSATTVTTSKAWVKRLVYVPAVDADTCLITDNLGAAAAVFKTKGATAATAYIYDVGGEVGACYDGMIVTNSGANDELYIYTA